MEYRKDGAEYIASLIDGAVRDGSMRAVVEGYLEISETVIIPSGFTLILRGAHLRLADGVFCNIFRNAGCVRERRLISEPDRDISIIGEYGAVLDGGNYNGLSEKTSEKDGMPHISMNNTLLFVNVEGFVVSGLRVINQRWWGLNFICCRKGLIRDIDFCSDDTMVSDDGTLVHGLSRARYGDVHVKNSDGIDLRGGCSDILIENITGFTEDDTVALTALPGRLESLYAVEGSDGDIHNVIIRGVRSEAYCANIRLLNQGGTKLYNILIDGMSDASLGSPHMDMGGNGVRVGDAHLYGSRHSTSDETFNITIRNVYSRAENAVSLAGAIKNLTLDNICGFDTNMNVVKNDAELSGKVVLP